MGLDKMFFFSDTVRQIILNSKEDCSKVIENLKEFYFPKRPTKSDYESFCCYIYITAIFRLNKIQYPFSVFKAEPPCPDFMLNVLGKSVGLEQTNATTNSYKHAEAVLNNYPEGSLIELSEYCSNETSRDSVELGLRRPNEPLQGDGWGNYGQEKQWASCFYNSIFEKTRKLNNSYITQCPNHELIIFDDTNTFASRRDYALNKLKRHCQKDIDTHKGDRVVFDKIHIISCDIFIYDLMGEECFCDVSKKSL